MPAALVAYPGRPPEVGREIETAIKSLSQSHGQHEIKSWVGNDICGRFLVDPILEKIDGAEFLIAAITALNFNVAFEIGYAIGRGRRILLVRNSIVAGDIALFPTLGIFDTLGYENYEIRRLKATQAHMLPDADAVYEINPAFWAALDVEVI